jgi:hypothetical protein
MEEALDHGIEHSQMRAVVTASDNDMPVFYRLPKVAQPERYAELLRRADAHMPAAARTGWRWRILFLRALLDEELHRSGGRPTATSEKYFAELREIYHAENAELSVATVGRADLARLTK